MSHADSRQVARFLVTGIANTAVGLAVIVFCAEVLGFSAYLANAMGYAAGLALGFALNRNWTFGDRQGLRRTAPRYLAAFAVSYAMNLLVLTVCLRLLQLPAVFAQAAALATYSVVFYLLCRLLVFGSTAARLDT